MKILFSGIRPSGVIHIGNYLGAIKNWVSLQNEYKSIFCVVDEHAITTPFDPKELKEDILKTIILYLACGIDPKKSLIFIQSQVSGHTELAWIFECLSPLGELARMTQFKEKAGLGLGVAGINTTVKIIVEASVNETPFKSANSGLLNYPCLMAADILLYKTNLVPVGEDQKQHLEFARDTAIRFNNKFGETFKVPEAYIIKETMRIMALDNPMKKMSKSAESKYNYISLLDAPEVIKDKIKKAVTDSGKEIIYDKENKPAISNLLSIMNGITDIKINPVRNSDRLFKATDDAINPKNVISNGIKEIEKKYEKASYAEFKDDLAEEMVKFLAPIQEKYEYYKKHEKEVLEMLEEGRKEAKKIAEKTMEEVKTKIGFL